MNEWMNRIHINFFADFAFFLIYNIFCVTSEFTLFLYRYCLEKEDPDAYVLCDVIGRTGIAHQWQTECLRVIGDSEKPLILQSLWKPKEGFCRRFEIHKRTNIEDRNANDRDTITAGTVIHQKCTAVFFLMLGFILGLGIATCIPSLYSFGRCTYIKKITKEAKTTLSKLGLRIISGPVAVLWPRVSLLPLLY